MSEQYGAYFGTLTAATTTAVWWCDQTVEPSEGVDLIIPSGGFGINVTTVTPVRPRLTSASMDAGTFQRHAVGWLLTSTRLWACSTTTAWMVATTAGRFSGPLMITTSSPPPAPPLLGMVGTYWIRWIRVEE